MTSHMDLDPYVTTSANTFPPQITAPSVLALQHDGHTLLQTPLSEDNELDYEDSLSEMRTPLPSSDIEMKHVEYNFLKK